MLDEVGLIHMNGRLYDPLTGRFISADFLIQSPENLQSYNRYSYGWNNPLSGTDPSGQSFWTSFRDSFIRAVAGYVCGAPCAAAVGAYQGSRNGGGLTGAIVGSIQGYVGYQYPLTDQTTGSIIWQNVAIGAMTNAATGCAGAAASGGSCGQAALSGALGTVGAAYGLPGSLIAGCAAGKIGGGSCSQGAIDAVGAYAGSSAVGYIVSSQQTHRDTATGAATVYIWDFVGTKEGQAWGHASMDLDNGPYINFWPGGERSKNGNIYSAEEIPNMTHEQVMSPQFEGRAPDHVIKVSHVDTAAIKKWWVTWQANNKWSTLTTNCSSTVYNALRAGGTPYGGQLIWTPNAVKDYANRVKE